MNKNFWQQKALSVWFSENTVLDFNGCGMFIDRGFLCL